MGRPFIVIGDRTDHGGVVSGDPTMITYWLAIGASITLGGSWLGYLAYLVRAPLITKQSVYTGEITLYAALLLVATCITLGVMVGSVGYLLRIRHRLSRGALLWASSALAIAVLVFAVTRPLIANAS